MTDVAKPEIVTRRGAGRVGLDLNQDHLALCETDRFGNPVRWMSIPLVTYGKSSGRILALTRDAAVKAVAFAKDITDPKTKRPMVRGIKANIRWFKDKLPAGLLDEIKSGGLKDVSIGFTYQHDATPGEWEGQKYDFVQRDIFIDHVVAPCPVGRCPSPYCGIGVDSVLEKTEVAAEDVGDCPICVEVKRLGLKESGKRLAAAFGPGAVEALKDAPEAKPDEKPADAVGGTLSGNPSNPSKPSNPTPPGSNKPEEKPAETPAAKPAELPSVEELINRTEEVLGLWKRLNSKPARF